MSHPFRWRTVTDAVVSTGITWGLVAKFMRTRIAQAGATVPIIGYALLWSKWAEEKLALSTHLEPGAFLTPTGRLLFLYWGAIFLTIALAIYWYRCPGVIKDAPSMDEFLFRRSQVPEDVRAERMTEVLRGAIEARPPIDVQEIRNDPGRRLQLLHERAHWSREATATLQAHITPVELCRIVYKYAGVPDRFDILRYFYRMHESVHPNHLISCAMTSLVGVVLWAVPAIETLYLVARRVLLPSFGLS